MHPTGTKSTPLTSTKNQNCWHTIRRTFFLAGRSALYLSKPSNCRADVHWASSGLIGSAVMYRHTTSLVLFSAPNGVFIRKDLSLFNGDKAAWGNGRIMASGTSFNKTWIKRFSAERQKGRAESRKAALTALSVHWQNRQHQIQLQNFTCTL